MSKIILGIHGMRNKPPKRLLERWWKDALQEGLRGIGRPQRFLKFKLVYWADFLYPEPLNPAVKDKEDPLFIANPYLPARTVSKKRSGTLRKKVLDYVRRQLDKIMINDDLSINYTAVTDLIIRRYFRDLDIYYTKQCLDRTNTMCRAKDAIREELARKLRKYRRRDILLIGHSMGSIIAYDVLIHSVPDVRIHTLVTMGSPLGLPPVMLKIIAEEGKKPRKPIIAKTPENIVHAWYNFSDLKDRVATDYTLSEDYTANSKNVRAVDVIIDNDYQYRGIRNPHNVYGYLRTPELAHVIDGFLNAGRPKALVWLSNNINHIVDKARRQYRGHALKQSFASTLHNFMSAPPRFHLMETNALFQTGIEHSDYRLSSLFLLQDLSGIYFLHNKGIMSPFCAKESGSIGNVNRSATILPPQGYGMTQVGSEVYRGIKNVRLGFKGAPMPPSF
jgi:pimeloyl-ACP methyl ester carboxylesterase